MSHNNIKNMRYKYLIYLLLAVLLAACSDDEPETPVSEYPSNARFEQIVLGKTWRYKSSSYFDSEGHEFEESPWIPGNGTPSAYLFSEEDCLAGFAGIVGQPAHSKKYSWNYNEDTGVIGIAGGWNSRYDLHIESLSDDELVARTCYGVLPANYYSYYYDIDVDCEIDLDTLDPGSYERVVLESVGEDEIKAFWEKYPERNK